MCLTCLTRIESVTVLITLITLGSANIAATTEPSDLIQTALDNRDPTANAVVIAQGDTVVLELATRLNGATPEEKVDIIGLLAAISSPATIPLLAPLMANPDYDTRVRATEAVYTAVIAHGAPRDQAFADKIVAAIQGEPTAGALLLGGLVPAAEEPLNAHVGQTRLVKLFTSKPPVPAGIPATVALSLLGDQDSRDRLEQSVMAGDPVLLEFYLTAMPMIDSPTILHALAAATLANEAPVGDGLPSGADPPRRLADIATETFVRQFDLHPGFELDETERYSEEKRRKVLSLITASMPQ